jgi:hypothetical protein
MYSIVPWPLPRCASQVLDLGAQDNFRGASEVLDSDTQAAAQGTARCSSQLFYRAAQADARGAENDSNSSKATFNCADKDGDICYLPL